MTEILKQKGIAANIAKLPRLPPALTSGPCGAAQHRFGTNPYHPVCGVGQRGSNSVSGRLGPLDRHHICKLQSVLRFERDGFHLPVPLCAVGVRRDFPDFGTRQAVFGSDDDFERAPPTCPRAPNESLASGTMSPRKLRERF